MTYGAGATGHPYAIGKKMNLGVDLYLLQRLTQNES